MGEFISEFTKSKAYKIQINILYNTKDTDDTNSNDTNSNDLNTNYFIINNMQDILIEEFKNTENYKYFKENYSNFKSTPLYIVKDSFYIDRNVMESLRKVASAGFPKERATEPVKAGRFKIYFDKFDKSNTKTAYKEALFDVFKDSALKAVPTKYRSENTQTEPISSITSVTTYDNLFNNKFFLELTGTETFTNLIEQIYEKTPDDTDLKQALNLFYNIFTKLNNKAKYEYFLDPNTVNYISKLIDDSTISSSSSSSSSNDDYYYMQNQRKPTLNDNRAKEEIYNKYYKYLFPTKKDISSLTDLDKDKILMFNNVYYIIKNIYLLDDTIISVTNYKINNAQKKKKILY